jgi:biotin transporter BioY
MGFLIGIIVVVFIIGLLSRKKGDNFLDTLSSGCGTIVWIIVLIAIAIFIFSQK